MTSGERRFARRLESHLEDDYLCWYDVPVGSLHQHPDFLVFHPRRGLLILEVKDWKLENIKSMDRLRVTLLVDGKAVRTASPMEQARQYTHRIKQLLESDPALVGEPGSSYEGKLIFPWGYGAVRRVICQDEMTESVEPEAFQKRLWDMFSVSFKCLLTLPQVDRVRWCLFPEIRVSPGDLRPGESLRAQGRDGAGYRPGDGSAAGAARQEHGGGPSGDSRRGVMRCRSRSTRSPIRRWMHDARIWRQA